MRLYGGCDESILIYSVANDHHHLARSLSPMANDGYFGYVEFEINVQLTTTTKAPKRSHRRRCWPLSESLTKSPYYVAIWSASINSFHFTSHALISESHHYHKQQKLVNYLATLSDFFRPRIRTGPHRSAQTRTNSRLESRADCRSRIGELDKNCRYKITAVTRSAELERGPIIGQGRECRIHRIVCEAKTQCGNSLQAKSLWPTNNNDNCFVTKCHMIMKVMIITRIESIHHNHQLIVMIRRQVTTTLSFILFLLLLLLLLLLLNYRVKVA